MQALLIHLVQERGIEAASRGLASDDQEMSNKRTPTHDVWAVQRGTNDKGFWSIIGAGWQHEDGLGMSLKLNMLSFAAQESLTPPSWYRRSA